MSNPDYAAAFWMRVHARKCRAWCVGARAGTLPPMTEEQKSYYRKLRYSAGFSRVSALNEVFNYRSAGLRAGAPAAQENQAAILPADRVGITGNGDALAQNSVTGTRNAHGCAARPCHPKPDAARVPGIPLRHQAGSTQSTTVAGGENANP